MVDGLPLAVLADADGRLWTGLLVSLAAGVVWGLVARLVAALRRRLRLSPWRRPLDPVLRPVRLRAINRALFWTAAGLMLVWTLPAALLEPEGSRTRTAIIAGLTSVDVAPAHVPTGRMVRPAWNVLPRSGWLFLGSEAVRIVAGPPGPLVELKASLDGEWVVAQGGRSALVNHHYTFPGQSHAPDLIKLERGRACDGNPDRLESYAAYGVVLRPPADGRVVRAVDGHPDMAIGQTDEASLVGNQVVIEIGPSRYVLLAHL